MDNQNDSTNGNSHELFYAKMKKYTEAFQVSTAETLSMFPKNADEDLMLYIRRKSELLEFVLLSYSKMTYHQHELDFCLDDIEKQLVNAWREALEKNFCVMLHQMLITEMIHTMCELLERSTSARMASEAKQPYKRRDGKEKK